MTAPLRPPARQPWPLWPIAIAIAVCLAGYTYVRLDFAKQQKAHEPFADSQRRADLAQLEAAGWQHTTAAFTPGPATAATGAATAVASEPGRPDDLAELRKLSTENWHLPIEYTAISAPAEATAAAPYAVALAATLDRARLHLAGFDVFRKDSSVLLLPRWAPLASSFGAGNNQISGTIHLPAGCLPTGRHTITLPALKQSSRWTVDVRGATAP